MSRKMVSSIFGLHEHETPCDHPFTLADGVTYQWRGCGGDRWVKLGNSNQLFWYCSAVPQNWTCNDVVVQGNWLC